jgi:hypothetical protein
MKDFILIKKYLIVLCAFAVIAPVYLTSQSNNSSLSFFIAVLFVEYISFSYVSNAENKYKGSSLLCGTPYTRHAIVKAKYLFIFAIYIFTVLVQLITASILPAQVDRLSVSAFGFTLFFLSLYFGVLIPVQYKLGYEKTRMIFLFIVFCTPFVLGYLTKWMRTHSFSFSISLPLPLIVQEWLPALIGLIIAFASMFLSLRIFERKDL